MSDINHNDIAVNAILREVEEKRRLKRKESLETDTEAGTFINDDGEYIRPSFAVRFFNSLYAWIETIIVSVVFAFIIVLFFFRMNNVYGISMQPTLYEGDRLIVMACFYTPSYGDIVAIQADNLPNSITGEMGELIVKRIIGLSGDEIFIDPESGDVFRNGEKLEETYTAASIDAFHMGNLVYPVTVPDGCIFVLGDNRNHSTDSRFADGSGEFYVGFINTDYVIGRAVLRVWPLEKFGVL